MTKTITVLVGSVALFMATGQALAWNEPDGFRDIPWGASLEEVKAKIPSLNCKSGSKLCSGNLTVGNDLVMATIFFDPEFGGGMTRVDLLFSNLRGMREAFLEKYGEPTARSGTSWFETLTWQGEKAVVTFDIRGRATIQTAERQRKELEQYRQKVRDRKKDL